MLKKLLIASAAIAFLGAGCSANVPVASPSVVIQTSNAAGAVKAPSFDTSVPVVSPLVIHGEAKGSWYSEAVFPVTIVDAYGKELGRGQAHADGEWMTDAFSPFTVTVEFSAPTNTTLGYVIFHNDNPSGDPARDKQLSVPVTIAGK